LIIEANEGKGYPPFLQLFIPTTNKEEIVRRGLRGKRVKAVKEGTLIATVDIGLTTNTGYCTTLEGRDTKPFRLDNTKEGFEKVWYLTMANKNRFGCDKSGDELPRCYQTSGGSESGERSGWKLIKVGETFSLHIIQEEFTPRPEYRPNDNAMECIFCQL